MPDRHFYLLRHHILFYIKFLLFCPLAPDEIRILCEKRGFPRSLWFLFGMKISRRMCQFFRNQFPGKSYPAGTFHFAQLQIQISQKKEKNNTSQMRLRSVFKMRASILNTATTEQMGCIIFSFFVYTKFTKIIYYRDLSYRLLEPLFLRFL